MKKTTKKKKIQINYTGICVEKRKDSTVVRQG